MARLLSFKYLLPLAVFCITIICFLALRVEQQETRIKKVGNNLVLVDWGGTNTDARLSANIIPFEKESGIKVTVISPSDYIKIKNNVEENENFYDVANVDSFIGQILANEGYLEQIEEYDPTKSNYVYDYIENAEIVSDVITFNTNFYTKESAPTNYTDFFDIKAFPGKRALRRFPVGILEAALIADGVEHDDLYPLDVNRALRKLDSIKSEIVWWDDGEDPINLLTANDVALAITWSGRAQLAKESGKPIDINYYNAIKRVAVWIVPKDAPNKENAISFIKYVTSPESQVAFSNAIPYGSTDDKVIALLSKNQLDRTGQSPRYIDSQIEIDSTYWTNNFYEVSEKFHKWLNGEITFIHDEPVLK